MNITDVYKNYNIKLELDLIPKPCWYLNLRKIFTREEWQMVRDNICSISNTNNKCSICGEYSNPLNLVNKYLEAHEVWEYEELDYGLGIYKIKLNNILPLCTMCHRSKHYGHSQLMGWSKSVDEHIKKINGFTDEALQLYLKNEVGLYYTRSNAIKHAILDLSKLNDLGYSDLYEKYKNYSDM